MRSYIFFFFLLTMFSASYSQDMNRIIFDEQAQKEVILGYCDAEGLRLTVWSELFDGTYNDYQPDMEIIFGMMPQMQDVDIVITLGTWCGDSKQHVPSFLRILKELNFESSRLTMIGLDRSFNGGEAGVRPYQTEKVPTFIFFRNGIELGRIIETPEKTLEEHMAKIFGQ